MITARRVTLVMIGIALLCRPALAQDWLVSPTPAIPLHVPVQPALPTAPAVTVPPVVLPPSMPVGVPMYPDDLQRLLDPYGLSHRAASPRNQSRTAVLPATGLALSGASPAALFDARGLSAPVGLAGTRFLMPPTIAFPNSPISWLFLGF